MVIPISPLTVDDDVKALMFYNKHQEIRIIIFSEG